MEAYRQMILQELSDSEPTTSRPARPVGRPPKAPPPVERTHPNYSAEQLRLLETALLEYITSRGKSIEHWTAPSGAVPTGLANNLGEDELVIPLNNGFSAQLSQRPVFTDTGVQFTGIPPMPM